jgi:hypothetical protein
VEEEGRHSGVPNLAETARFELAVRVTPYDSLANCWFQPLTHVSGFAAKRGYSEGNDRDQLGSCVTLLSILAHYRLRWSRLRLR